MRSFFAGLAIGVALAITGSTDVQAQQRQALERPKIGLVLSGGGAKGASHVGVIKVLEELGVPIDYIAGTSMGAIVGGLYASGMPAEELERVIKSIDWDDVFDDKPPRANRDFRRKLDDEGFLVRYKIGFKDGKFVLPLGLIDAQKLNLVLREHSIRAIGIHDFDKLKIPFRAVAADIETGEPVILGSGDLGRAMRASMSVSGFFPPMEIDGHLLVDGGLANNVPIDVARKMGADIVIVVGFPERLKKRDELTSGVSIVLQSLDLLIAQNSKLQLKTLQATDIYIEPALGDIGATNFRRAGEAIDIGEQAARQMTDKLKNLARPAVAQRLDLSGKTNRVDTDIKVDFIRIENKSKLSDGLIKARLRLKPGDRLDIDRLEEDIDTIYGLDYFDQVFYAVVIEKDKTGVVVTAVEKSTGLDSFRFGLNLETDFDGEDEFNIAVRYQKEGLNDLGGELLLEGIVGEKLGAHAVFIQPLDPATRYFISSSLGYLARDVNVYESGDRLGELRISELSASLRAARQLGTWGALSAGFRFGQGWKDVNVGPPTLPHEDFDIGEFSASFDVDTLDDLHFPKSGVKGLAEFRRSTTALGGELDFSTATPDFVIANTWGRNTLLVAGHAGFTFDGESSAQDLFSLGGMFRLSGFSSDELTGQNKAFGGLVFYRGFGKQTGLIKFPVYVGGSLEAGNVWQDRSDMALDDLILAASAFVGVDTPLGPVYFTYGHAEGGHNALYLKLGQTF